VKGATPRPEDEVSLVKATTTHNVLCLFTTRGRIFGIKCLALPAPKTGKGKQISSLAPLEPGERVVAMRDMNHGSARFVFLVTRNGMAKRLPIGELGDLTRAGRRVIGLHDDDDIARVRITSGSDELLLTSAMGQTLRVDENEITAQGRAGRGVRGIKLHEGDKVVGCDVIIPGRQVLFVSERGIGKRTPYDDFPTYHRNSGGVRAMRLNERTGNLIGAWGVAPDDELVIISGRGRVVRMEASEVSSLSRTATGYTMVKLDEGDVLADVSVIKSDQDAGGE
jgi:DNA gyrase subunit A